ncbi:phage repressor protein [Vibrio cholerae]|uniref:phage repressor protein n=1 Tax=Vibrio cholerae TaxID=666 RepID=UPI0004E2C982|nr:phage repressor protein [Vibrio cholerae]EGR2474331.1 phage repressor protein [Vibrio cholerae]ELZ1193145.1 phage repressor protein [Vibrio cholerae]KFD84678.1 mu DNA-binding domain protein [Vibrio cholerae]GHZ61398.1 repressor [Vibrio cholerae]
MKEWFRAIELIHVDGMPNTRQGINSNANRNRWLKRKASGRGSAVEYHISNFHEDVQKLLVEKYGTEEEKRKSKDVINALGVHNKKQNTPQEASNISKIIPLSDVEKWARLPVYDVHAAAGAGTLIESEFQIGVFSIPLFLLHEFGLKEDYCSVIFVDGNSMLPTVADRDRVLVDIRECPHPAKDGVYVIRIDDAVYIKRLNWNIAKGVYDVISDNPKYAPFEINHNNGRNFKIIGRVVTVLMKAIV